MISFDVSRTESSLIERIANRALAGCRSEDMLLLIEMDLVTVHANGCPLKLEDLLAASDADFAHDLLGIRTHLDRDSGQLNDLFRPRFAVDQH